MPVRKTQTSKPIAARIFYTLGAVLMVLGLLSVANPVLVAVALSVWLAFILSPLVILFERWRLSRRANHFLKLRYLLSERQGASRRFFPNEPAASALLLTTQYEKVISPGSGRVPTVLIAESLDADRPDNGQPATTQRNGKKVCRLLGEVKKL